MATHALFQNRFAPATRRILLVSLLAATTPLAAAENTDGAGAHPGWEKSGDVLQWGIPLVGLGLSFLLDANPGSDFAFELFESSGTQAPGLN